MEIDKNLNQGKKEDLILFLEIIALLHDIGKLSANFIHSKAIDNSQEDTHALLPLNDSFPDIFKKTITIPGLYNKQPPFEFYPLSLICSHHGCERCQRECSFNNKNPIVSLLRLADQRASEEEKGFLQDISRQPHDDTYFSTPLGVETLVHTNKIDQYRLSLWKKINKAFIKDSLQDIKNQVFQAVKPIYTGFPSETRRPGNDLTLWDHSFTTATYFKIALYETLLNGKNIVSTQKIPVVFLKIKNRPGKLRKMIEETYCAGNLLLSLNGFQIYALGESFLKKDPLAKYNISESFSNLIPDLEEAINNLYQTSTRTFFIPDYQKLFQLVPQSTFTHPFTPKQREDAQSIVNKVVARNYLREKKDIEDRIQSISRHINNLEKGRWKEEKKNELLLKKDDVDNLNSKLNDIAKIKVLFSLTEEYFHKTILPDWDMPIINLYREWLKINTSITLKEYILYRLFQRESSISSSSNLTREIKKLLTKVKIFLLKRGCHCWVRQGALYIKECLTDEILSECRKIINKYADKGCGLIPLYLYEIDKNPPLSTGVQYSFHRIKEKSIISSGKKMILELTFDNEDRAKIPLTNGSMELDRYRLYRQESNGRFTHLSEVEVGNSIFWFFPLERY